jgi:hypothetical protein
MRLRLGVTCPGAGTGQRGSEAAVPRILAYSTTREEGLRCAGRLLLKLLVIAAPAGDPFEQAFEGGKDTLEGTQVNWPWR